MLSCVFVPELGSLHHLFCHISTNVFEPRDWWILILHRLQWLQKTALCFQGTVCRQKMGRAQCRWVQEVWQYIGCRWSQAGWTRPYSPTCLMSVNWFLPLLPDRIPSLETLMVSCSCMLAGALCMTRRSRASQRPWRSCTSRRSRRSVRSWCSLLAAPCLHANVVSLSLK